MPNTEESCVARRYLRRPDTEFWLGLLTLWAYGRLLSVFVSPKTVLSLTQDNVDYRVRV